MKQGHPGGDVTPLFIPKDDDIYPTLTLHSPSTQVRSHVGQAVCTTGMASLSLLFPLPPNHHQRHHNVTTAKTHKNRCWAASARPTSCTRTAPSSAPRPVRT